MFLQSGNVIRVTGSKRLSNLHGLISFAPEHALLLALTTCAVMGVPPFGTFCSELSVLVSSADARLWVVGRNADRVLDSQFHSGLPARWQDSLRNSPSRLSASASFYFLRNAVAFASIFSGAGIPV